jgi:16S rRNA G966 N2-methylase RsmD
MNKLILGDCIESLKKVPTASVDLICTDPPYGIGFKGHVWDKAVPNLETWRACLRVLKPGGFAFIMSAPRQDVLSQMIARLGQAGFVTDFTPIYWTFPSGLPKAANISKMADRRVGARRKVVATTSRIVKRGLFFGTYGAAPVRRVREKITDAESPQAKALDGAYAGFQPKPAVEVVIVAMKPLSQKTFLDQALSNGKGITWLDDCRIPVHATTCPSQSQLAAAKGKDRLRGGRFPANLLVSGSVLNNARSATKHGPAHIASIGGVSELGNQYPSAYSHYFDLDAWAETLPFLKVSKPNKHEKGRNNTHPTVKPLKLMSYLVTLGSRGGDVVLDPFLGSGTTAVAAISLGRQFVGIERERAYLEIARARVDAATKLRPLGTAMRR